MRKRLVPGACSPLLRFIFVDITIEDTAVTSAPTSNEATLEPEPHSTRRDTTTKMSDDEERVTMPFKFVTGTVACSLPPLAGQY